MTCAGCVSRVERKLNELDSVDASVNLATESARVRFDPARVQLDDLVGAVTAIGYGAAPAAGLRDDTPTRPVRLIVAALLSAPLVALMLPPLQFSGWEWLSFALATPVVLWAGLPFHRAALLNARHRAATMDTLISIGTLAAWGWSVVALALGTGETVLRGRRDHHDADPARPLARVERAAQVWCGDPRADRARSERGARASRWSGGRRQHRRARGRRPIRRASRARRSRPTASSRTASPRSTRRC